MKRNSAPWTAPGEACHRNSTSNSTLTAAPCSGTLQRHPCSCTSNPAPKRKHATLPILEAITPIASLSGQKKKTYTRKKSQLWNIGQPWEKRAGALVKRQSCMISYKYQITRFEYSKTVFLCGGCQSRCDFNKKMRLKSRS